MQKQSADKIIRQELRDKLLALNNGRINEKRLKRKKACQEQLKLCRLALSFNNRKYVQLFFQSILMKNHIYLDNLKEYLEETYENNNHKKSGIIKYCSNLVSKIAFKKKYNYNDCEKYSRSIGKFEQFDTFHKIISLVDACYYEFNHLDDIINRRIYQKMKGYVKNIGQYDDDIVEHGKDLLDDIKMEKIAITSSYLYKTVKEYLMLSDYLFPQQAIVIKNKLEILCTKVSDLFFLYEGDKTNPVFMSINDKVHKDIYKAEILIKNYQFDNNSSIQ